MFGQQPEVVNVAAALGIGLLIGLERERRKATGGGRAPGGVRTFTLSAVLGAVAMVTGQQQLLAVAALCVGGFALLSYAIARDQDPGTTRKIAHVVTVVLGGPAVKRPGLAVGLSEIVTVLPAACSARFRCHRPPEGQVPKQHAEPGTTAP